MAAAHPVVPLGLHAQLAEMVCQALLGSQMEQASSGHHDVCFWGSHQHLMVGTLVMIDIVCDGIYTQIYVGWGVMVAVRGIAHKSLELQVVLLDLQHFSSLI